MREERAFAVIETAAVLAVLVPVLIGVFGVIDLLAAHRRADQIVERALGAVRGSPLRIGEDGSGVLVDHFSLEQTISELAGGVYHEFVGDRFGRPTARARAAYAEVEFDPDTGEPLNLRLAPFTAERRAGELAVPAEIESAYAYEDGFARVARPESFAGERPVFDGLDLALHGKSEGGRRFFTTTVLVGAQLCVAVDGLSGRIAESLYGAPIICAVRISSLRGVIG